MNWFQRFKRSTAHTQANIVCTFVVMVATIAYVIVADLQWHEIKRTNDLTQQALSGNATSLAQTLEKMQSQVNATNNLYGEAKKQTTLMQEQTEGLGAAVVQVYGLDIQSFGRCCQIPVYMQNNGHVIANDVSAKVTVTVFKIEGNRRETGPYTFTISPHSQKASTPDDSEQLTRIFDIPNFSQETWDSIGDLERYVHIEANWRYENGFGRTVTNSACSDLVDTGYFHGSAAQGYKTLPRIATVECGKLISTIAQSREQKAVIDREYEQRMQGQNKH